MTFFSRKHLLFITLALFLSALSWLGKDAIAQIEDKTKGAWIDEGHPLVIELFTSSNCSACMPADRILYDVSKQKNVIALGCHIDYWDKETLMDPTGLEECTYRQWAYRNSGRLSGGKIRVPHFMINGEYSIGRSKTEIFYHFLTNVKNMPTPKPSFIHMKWKDKDTLLVEMPDANRDIREKDSFSVWLIRYQDYLIQKVSQGDTAGRVLRFTNVVRDAKHIAKWHGERRTIEVDVPMPAGGKERGGYVTIIHEINGSEIVAAGKVPDYKIRKKKKEAPKTKDAIKDTPAPITTPLLSE